jgi:opacity protein-like surface antigen
MKKITIVTIVLAAFLAAQMFGASQASAAKVETAKGTRALVFQFSGLSNLGAGAYKGGLGMRYYIQNGLALRPGLQVDFSAQKTKDTIHTPAWTDAKHNITGIGLDLAVEKHATGMGSLSPYIGAEVGVSMMNDKTEPSLPATISTGTLLKATEKGMKFGIGGLAGFEWGFTEGVTLGAEYTLGLSFNTGKTEYTYQGAPVVTTGDTKGMSLGFGTASFYLSVNW